MTSAAPADDTAITGTNEISSCLELLRWGMAVLRLRGKKLFLSRIPPKGTAPWVLSRHRQVVGWGPFLMGARL